MVLIQKTLNFPLRDTIFFYKQIPATKKVKLKIETMKAKLGLIPTKKKKKQYRDNDLDNGEDHFDLLPILFFCFCFHLN